ncbi:MAG: alpha/beta fold hydrolase [Gemmobacter sp.]
MTSRRLAILSLLTAAAAAGCGVVADRRATARAEEAVADFPPTGRILTVGGRRIHADTRGRGPDVVLLHGAGGNTRDMTFSLADRLAREFRVTAFDRPGLGHSDDLGEAGVNPAGQARALRAAAAQIGIRRPVVVGHSYGAAVAMGWALEAPAETAAVVSLAGATMPWPGTLGPFYRIAASDFGGATVVPLLAAFVSEDRAEDVVARIFRPDPVPAGYVDYVGAPLTLRADVLRANARQVNGLKPYLQAMSALYPDLRLPVEILHGSADRTVGLAIHSEPLSRVLPNANLVVLPGVGHMPHHAREAETVGAIRRAARRAGLR